MYLECKSCGWSQDEFWSKDGYNPFNTDQFNSYREVLFEEGGQDRIVRWLWGLEARIEKMQVKTLEEFEKIKDSWKCPECKSPEWHLLD